MSPLRGWLTPEARATVEAVLAKLAAPGMCNPDDETPVVDGAAGEAGYLPLARTRFSATPAARPNATTTDSTRPCARCWPAEN